MRGECPWWCAECASSAEKSEWGFGQMMGKGGDDDGDVRPSVSPSVVVVVVGRWRRLSFSLRALSRRER